ncbi:hypothetical protein H9636_04695 [Ureibacillus sp. Re31]|uniref:DUF4367 domain-containing protein n=1 Tax=Ureibacillus galli TaxID=2762222 RepID=A0ABR8X9F3_9BACL|nr:hypothetical protein [Ureibacillus galli]MBD8025951.1 hypothetical protein [Ureibacillus galli]
MIYLNKLLLLFLISTVICGAINIGKVNANSHFQPQTIEESYLEIGYKSVGEALRDYEHHYKEKLQLPLRVPPIVYTHVFARTIEGNKGDLFEMQFINEKSNENNFLISVAPKDSIEILDKEVINKFKLKSGNTAYLLDTGRAVFLIFEKDNLQYRFSIDKRVSKKITPEILVQIANSTDN